MNKMEVIRNVQVPLSPPAKLGGVNEENKQIELLLLFVQAFRYHK